MLPKLNALEAAFYYQGKGVKALRREDKAMWKSGMMRRESVKVCLSNEELCEIRTHCESQWKTETACVKSHFVMLNM